MRNFRQKVIWSELPVEVLRSIAIHLKGNRKDVQNFRSVCKKWRRATAISALLPFVMGSETLFSSSVYLIRPPVSGTPWIVASVEITKGEFELCNPLSGEPLFDIPENFTLDRFQPRRLSVDYHMADEEEMNDCSRALSYHEKVLLFFKDRSIPSMVDDGSLLVLFRGGQLGGSPPVKPEYQYGTELPWFDISYGSLDKFDDILSFRGVIYALDRLGKLYRMFTDQFAVLKTLVEKPVIKPDCVNKGWGKRLVGSSKSGDLFMIMRINEMVKVFKLCKVHNKKSWSWVKVKSFGDDPMVLFVSKVYSFFVSAAEFPGFGFDNYIVFSNDAFHPYSKPNESKFSKENIQIFWLGGHIFMPIADFKPIADFLKSGLFSVPEWALQAQSSPSPPHYQSNPEEDEMMESDATNQNGASSQTHGSAPSNTPKSEKQNTKIHSTSATQGKSSSHLPVSEIQHKKDISENKVSIADFPPVISSVLACEPNIGLQGLESLGIRPNLLPTLQMIWNKHGNLIGEKTVRSKVMLTLTLESLANIIIFLQKTTLRTLTDSLAQELASNLHDLQCVGLKVDWLVAFVEWVLTLHKSKPLIESIMAINKSKAQIDEKEREFLARSAKVKQELDEKKACLSAKLPFPEPIDLDQCLGEGLL
ncbi:hypothetical protein SOVF_062740 isoform A [Spinacia oleracea]|uniref:Uncharacterized protein LOC110782486 isoform X2 n=1 Tax=Spinacia oleracea TaxID=3562 RepID=A0A9R0JPM8_SPIOL|nr:uncharacterized protein LOC110782486 isoform X2 [Spinacia oleracea]XP_056684183.1 uncharacterized protein LOC130459097 isoform X2 [Spinacia oleracea]KNA19290.1 hypothetical protein SOVF_062740 isoform A [Spinacia oleracea]